MNLQVFFNEMKENKFILFNVIIMIVSFIFYPIWLLGPTSIFSGIRISIVILLVIFIFLINLTFKIKLKQGEDTSLNTESELKPEKIYYNKYFYLLISIILNLWIYRDAYYKITLASGYDEAAHVSITLLYYSLLSLNSNSAYLHFIILIILFSSILLVAITFQWLINYFEKHKKNIFKMIFILFLSLPIFYAIGYYTFDYLTIKNLIIHPNLDAKFIRFPPLKQIIGAYLLLIFGIHDSVLRLQSILMIAFSGYIAFTILIDTFNKHPFIKDSKIRLFLLVIISLLISYDSIILYPFFIYLSILLLN